MTGFDIAMAGLLSFGQVIPSAQREIVKHAGLQMIHADGAVTLRLKETDREERAVDGGRVVTVKLQDEHYPVYITRYVRTWNDCDAVETWYELRHEELGPVRLLRADSFASRVNCRADVV